MQAWHMLSSFCLFVTLVHFDKSTEDVVQLLSPTGSPSILIFQLVNCNVITFNMAPNTSGIQKISCFLLILHYDFELIRTELFYSHYTGSLH